VRSGRLLCGDGALRQGCGGVCYGGALRPEARYVGALLPEPVPKPRAGDPCAATGRPRPRPFTAVGVEACCESAFAAKGTPCRALGGGRRL
jgi:hypothetical protein